MNMGVIWKFKSKWITPKVGRLAGFCFFFIQSFHVTLPTPIVLPFLWEGNSPEGETCSFFLILGYVSCLGEREREVDLYLLYVYLLSEVSFLEAYGLALGS